MKKREFALGFCVFMIFFYIAIVMYTLFFSLNIRTLGNFIAALFFEFIGIIVIAYFLLSNILSSNIKIGFFAPLIMINIFYILLLNVLNLGCITMMSSSTFVLLNLLILFMYCLISAPMYIMGRK